MKSLIFFVAALFVLSCVRLAFINAYRPEELSWSEYWPAIVMGLRVDAKWLALLLIPAWLLIVLSAWQSDLKRCAAVAAVFAQALLVGLAVVNFGFFGFYGTPISPIIFGFAEDDTTAILKTIWTDWPVGLYLAAFLAGVWFPLLSVKFADRLLPTGLGAGDSVRTVILLSLAGTLAFVAVGRGSFGKFPLRQQNYAVSVHAAVNNAVHTGASAFFEALKGRMALSLEGKPTVAFAESGFSGSEDARSALLPLRKIEPHPAVYPGKHVVLAVMESMGRDIFVSQRLPANDVLGSLAEQLASAVVFKNAVSVENGTFPSLEGLLFDTPFTPLTQSRFGRQALPFFKLLPFKEAGYKLVFLTAGPESWRQMDENFPVQGFSQVVGARILEDEFPEAETGVWGIGDRWMFKRAEELLEEADRKGEKLFLVLLSATNHPPHKVPDKRMVKPVDPQALPDFVLKREKLAPVLETYQYASDALGDFVAHVRSGDLAGKTVIAATGDHNTRLEYEGFEHIHHMRGVPIVFWLPEGPQPKDVDNDRWACHRDIMPTLAALVLGRTPEIQEGRDLFASESDIDLALSFSSLGKMGFALGAWGAVGLDGGGKVTCLEWQGDELRVAACSKTAAAMGAAARAERALAEYKVREGVVKK